MGPSETAREREVFKYYQPPFFSAPADGTRPPPQSSHDASLTAFAQLAALRLNAQRGFITFCTREFEYVAAEGSRTLSLRTDTVHHADDGLWVGETAVKKEEGLCWVALEIFTRSEIQNPGYLVVEDLSLDARFNHIPSVTDNHSLKFYAAVPLLSPTGLVIGVFSVVDVKPRASISDAEVDFLKDVASTVVVHLETKRSRQQHKRAESMIRALGLYVEGKSSLREWWLNTGHKLGGSNVAERARRGESLNAQADQEFGIQESTDDPGIAGISNIGSSIDRARNRDLQCGNQAGRPGVVRSSISTASLPATDPPEATFTLPPDPSTSPTLESAYSADRPSRVTPADITMKYPIETSDNVDGARLQEAVLTSEMKESISRATNLIREGMSVDGALFLDASVGTFGGRAGDSGQSAPGALKNKSQGSSSFTSDSEGDASRRKFSKDVIPSKSCGVLGYSTSTRSSLNMHETSNLHMSVPESLLRQLLRRYPHGKVFNFDDDGHLSSTDNDIRKRLSEVHLGSEPDSTPKDARERKRKNKKMSRQVEANHILKILPGARCVAFFPLWDSHKERWFAGSLAWTCNPTRVLDPEEDLTYLASFGNSIMAEVSRLNALVASQTKASFVSSISHELRSPLHGILASVEFLQDTAMTILQQEMVGMVNSCGRTLLDTLNHVLDFTKITTAKGDRGHKGKTTGNRNDASPVISHVPLKSPVDICLLTEEVLEGLYTGSGFGKQISKSDQTSTISPLDPTQFIAQDQSPMIIVNMQWKSDWCLNIDPGAWRRLVMNVFGNALKYTDTGYIRIDIGSDKSTKRGVVTLTVTDSGKGISSEYLRHRLYTPFAQENSLSVGSGLGLSIVRHIVDELGGSINIDSEREAGTEVAITLPLRQTDLKATPFEIEDVMSHVRKELQDVETCLVGFDIFPSLVDEPTGILSVEAKRMFYFKDALTTLLRDWFKMKVSVASKPTISSCKVFFIMEATLNDMLSNGELKSTRRLPDDQKMLLLVLCTKSYRPHPTIELAAFDIEYIQQPIGPRKLARTLGRCLNYFSHSQSVSRSDTASDTAISTPKAEDVNSLQTLPSQSDRRRYSLINSGDSADAASFPNPESHFTGSTVLSQSQPQTPGGSGIFLESEEASSRFILLVEDNAINLRILVTYMRKLGIEHVTAENGLKAVQAYKAATQPFSLVLMDISMPVMDGLEASRRIRKLERSSDRTRAPIIAITGAASDAVRQEAYSAGIDQFLTKPVSLKILKEILEEYAPKT